MRFGSKRDGGAGDYTEETVSRAATAGFFMACVKIRGGVTSEPPETVREGLEWAELAGQLAEKSE
jgi:hypothetical protein